MVSPTSLTLVVWLQLFPTVLQQAIAVPPECMEYSLVDSEGSRLEQELLCNTNNALVAQIESQEVLDSVVAANILPSSQGNCSDPETDDIRLWIGGFFQDDETGWAWARDRPMLWTNWAQDEPQDINNDSNFISMNLCDDYKWSATMEDEELLAICMREKADCNTEAVSSTVLVDNTTEYTDEAATTTTMETSTDSNIPQMTYAMETPSESDATLATTTSSISATTTQPTTTTSSTAAPITTSTTSTIITPYTTAATTTIAASSTTTPTTTTSFSTSGTTTAEDWTTMTEEIATTEELATITEFPSAMEAMTSTTEEVATTTEFDECHLDPPVCKNDGVCYKTPDSFYCACLASSGYTGETCEDDIDECEDAGVCFPGQCVNTNGSYYCDCSNTGLTGPKCLEDVNECQLPFPVCAHGSRCVNMIGNYSCDCALTGYQGRNCHEDINECTELTDPCGTGNCSNLPGTFMCNCTSTGYSGSACEVDHDECTETADLCMNEGHCINTPGSFVCDCFGTGFHGILCDIETDECSTTDEVCQHEGVCTNTVGSFFCYCDGTGFQGENCQRDIDECSYNEPMCGAGTCVNIPGSFTCLCDGTGMTGELCEVQTPCFSSPCRHGTCSEEGDTFVCTCLDGYEGDYCDVDINECELAKAPGFLLCMHGGTCLNRDGSYECVCREGRTGRNCEQDFDECKELDPCSVGSQCFNLDNDYECICLGGLTGPHCTQDINECTSSPCTSHGLCLNEMNAYKCLCLAGYTGERCEQKLYPGLVDESSTSSTAPTRTSTKSTDSSTSSSIKPKSGKPLELRAPEATTDANAGSKISDNASVPSTSIAGYIVGGLVLLAGIATIIYVLTKLGKDRHKPGRRGTNQSTRKPPARNGIDTEQMPHLDRDRNQHKSINESPKPADNLTLRTKSASVRYMWHRTANKAWMQQQQQQRAESYA